MRKKYFYLVTALVMVGLMVAPTGALAGKRIQDEGRGTVSLDSVGDAPEQATGVAKFTLKSSDNGVYTVKMSLDVENLPKRAGQVFQTWLVDTDTGFRNPILAFQTDNDGDSDESATQRMNFFAPYDKIIVTSERRNDSDPSANGPEVLDGTME